MKMTEYWIISIAPTIVARCVPVVPPPALLGKTETPEYGDRLAWARASAALICLRAAAEMNQRARANRPDNPTWDRRG